MGQWANTGISTFRAHSRAGARATERALRALHLHAVHMRGQRRYLRLADRPPRAHVIVQPQQRLIVCLQRLSSQQAPLRC